MSISYSFIKMMGAEGLLKAAQLSILNATYMASKLEKHYKIAFVGSKGRVAHEFIIDLGAYKKKIGVSEEDVAKRLMDYGFHAPTMSWPLVGGLMIEPTESEDKREIDRFIDALISIKHEIQEIEDGVADKENNVLKNAPHTLKHLL